jgi:hypothetical protein
MRRVTVDDSAVGARADAGLVAGDAGSSNAPMNDNAFQFSAPLFSSTRCVLFLIPTVSYCNTLLLLEASCRGPTLLHLPCGSALQALDPRCSNTAHRARRASRLPFQSGPLWCQHALLPPPVFSPCSSAVNCCRRGFGTGDE